MNKEQYENLIELLKQALKFYADSGNYDGAMGTIAPIASDEYGSQARFALQKVQETLDADKKLQEDYNRVINDTINAIENNPIDVSDMIKTIKDIESNGM
jgi:hypothetical protein